MNILGPTWRMPLPHFLPLEHIPLLIFINPTSNLSCCTPQVPYHSFLRQPSRPGQSPWASSQKTLALIVSVGVSPQIGHSSQSNVWRNAAFHHIILLLLVRQMHGRWRSPQIADSYIGTETQGDLSLMAFHKARGTPYSLSSTDM